MKKNYQEQLKITAISTMMLVLLLFPVSMLNAQIATTTPASICGEGTLVLGATATSGTIKWYTTPFYGEAVATGGTFTTPTLIVTTAYYVDAVDANNCSLNPNKVRVPVLATISSNSMQASIFYASTTFCKSATDSMAITRTGSAGGRYTVSPSGLTISQYTGAFKPSTSTVGTYTVTYTVTASQGCVENPATTTVTITTAPSASSIVYSSSPYCTSLTEALVTLTNPNSGTYSAEPSGLSIDASSGTVNPSTSEPGTYTVTYVVTGAGGCAPQAPTTTLTITELPAPVLTYVDAPFCISNSSAQAPTLTGTGAYTGGTYRYTNSTGGQSGLTFSSGNITPSTSTAGTYTIYYSAPSSGHCAAVEVSTSVIINPLPTASLSGTTSVCQNATEPNVTFTGTLGTAPFTFTYTVNGGGSQTVTTVSGNSVTVSQPTTSAGTYAYTLVSVADANECSQSASGTATITVTGTPIATFSYIGTPFCKIGTVSPTLAPGGSLGTFSGTGVTFVSTSTGEINLASTSAGNYTIKNSISTCGTPVEATTSITINTLPTASISGTTACGSSVLTATTNATSPSFVWYKGGVVIDSQTASTLSASQDGSYTVKVTDGTNGCEFTSTAYALSIIALPTASITGTLTTCNAATTITAVTNAASPSYVWYKNDEVISGQTGGTLTINVSGGAAPTGSGDYKVKVHNGVTTCENTSAASFVTIGLIDDPGTVGGGQTVCTDASNSTLLTLSGTKSTVRKWQYSINSGSTWTDIANTNTTYTATGLTQTTQFRASVQNGICDVAYSVPATVTVVPDPSISVQPTATTSECIGGTAQLSVTASNGTPSLYYTWCSNTTNSNVGGSVIPGAVSSTYTPPTTDAGTRYYYVVVGASGSGCGALTSEVAAVTTVATSPSWASYSNPIPTTFCAGGTVAFSVSITGGSGGTVSWIRSNNATPGAGTEVTVTTGDTPGAGTWYYRPHYTPTNSGCVLADGTQTTVTVNPLPTITTGGIAAAVTYSATSQTTSLAYTATTQSPAAYSIVWSSEAHSANLTNQSSTTFAFAAEGGSIGTIVIPANVSEGSYTGTMTISNANGCTSIQSISLNVNPGAPTAASPQYYCGSGTISTLTATTSGSIKWYNASTGGTAYSSSDTLVSGTHYYASQTVNGRESTLRTDVLATKNPQPTLTAVVQNGTACYGSMASMHLTGMLPNCVSTVNYTINGTAKTPIASVSADASGVADFNTALVYFGNNGQTLQITGITVTSANPSCQATFAIGTTLSVYAVDNCVTAQTTCYNSNPPQDLVLTGQTGTVLKWIKSANADMSSPTDVVVTSSTTLTSAQMGALTSNTYFAAVVQSGSCTVAISSPILIAVTLRPSFTVQPSGSEGLGVDVTYTTQSGMTNYAWTYPESVLGTDYTITSGGTTVNNTVTLKWITTGSRYVSINYTTPGGCTADTPTRSNGGIGSNFQGGKLFYILNPSDAGYEEGVRHGLIAAIADQGTAATWWNGTYTTTGATATAVGTGSANTTAIISSQGNTGSHAAKLCADYTNNETGTGVFSDWFLPSKDELNKIWENRIAIGNLATNYYWSSSEVDASNAMVQYFSEGYSSDWRLKNSTRYVRAIRSF